MALCGQRPRYKIYFAAVFKLLERTIGKGEPPFPSSTGAAAPDIHLAPADAATSP